MTAEDLIELLEERPFVPLRLRLDDGRSYEIRHPEMISLGRSTAHIDTFLSDEAEQAKQREHEVSLLLMESVEPLDAASAQDGQQ